MQWNRFLVVVTVVLFAVSVGAAPVSALQQEEGDDDGGDTIINIDIDAIVEVIQDLIDEVEQLGSDLGDIIVEAGVILLVKPFQFLARSLSDVFTHAMVAYPDVRQEDVLDVHALVFQLSLLLAVPVFIWIGFQHITGQADGIRPTVELLVVIVAGGLSPWLLHYPVQLSHLAAIALRPEQVSVVGNVSIAVTTALIIWFKAVLLLALVILYVVRSFYLLWYVAAAPLIFLLTYFRPTRKYMSSLTGLFIGFLLIAPMDLIAYRLVLALLDMQGSSPISDYIWGLGGYFVMLALPYQILSSSSSLVLPAMMFARESAGRVEDRVKPRVREQYEQFREGPGLRELGQRKKNRFLSEGPERVTLNHRSKEEVELESDNSRLKEYGDRVKSRFRNDQPSVEVEDDWHQDSSGDWSKESRLKEDGDD